MPEQNLNKDEESEQDEDTSDEEDLVSEQEEVDDEEVRSIRLTGVEASHREVVARLPRYKTHPRPEVVEAVTAALSKATEDSAIVDGQNILHVAARAGQIRVLRWLLKLHNDSKGEDDEDEGQRGQSSSVSGFQQFSWF